MYQSKEEKILKSKRGITLISLVVTIIILLILAGVSIGMLTGDNGILNRATEASKKTDEAGRKEKADLDKMGELINEMASGTVTVEQVTDEHPGQLEEDGDEKVINSIEDLVVFANSVTSGTTYNEQTVKLGLSLDFNSSKSYVEPYRTDYGKYGYNGELKILLTSGEGFKSIGITTNEEGYENKNFLGTFDGNGNIINNLYMNKDGENYTLGFFGNNYEKIKNLGLENCNIYGKALQNENTLLVIGGFCGRNYGEINGCYVTGKIEGYIENGGKLRVGGISGIAEKGNVSNCYNVASILATGIGFICQGGVIGFEYSGECNVSNCYNRGNIISKNESSSERSDVGGIMGGLSSGGMIKQCYNLGDIKANFVYGSNIGGFLGYICDDAVLNNCHSICDVEADENRAGEFVGYVRRGNDFGPKINECSFFDHQSLNPFFQNDIQANATAVSSIEKMIDILEVLGDRFKMSDSDYPILKWQ